MHRDINADAAPRTREQGQTMAEYAMVLAVITLGIMLTIQLLGNSAGGLIERVADLLGG